MQTKTLIQATANVVKITSLAKGDKVRPILGKPCFDYGFTRRMFKTNDKIRN